MAGLVRPMAGLVMQNAGAPAVRVQIDFADHGISTWSLVAGFSFWHRQHQPHAYRELVGIAQLCSVDLEDVIPASRRAELALGNRGERVPATYGDHAIASRQVLIKIRDPESPTDLQPVGASGQHRGVGGCDLAPVPTVPVVPLGETPEIVTGLHHMVLGVINSPVRGPPVQTFAESRSAR